MLSKAVKYKRVSLIFNILRLQQRRVEKSWWWQLCTCSVCKKAYRICVHLCKWGENICKWIIFYIGWAIDLILYHRLFHRVYSVSKIQYFISIQRIKSNNVGIYWNFISKIKAIDRVLHKTNLSFRIKLIFVLVSTLI